VRALEPHHPAGQQRGLDLHRDVDGGFASAVALSCANLAAGASCSFAPSVTPPANGTVSSTLTVNAGTAAAGTSTFQALGTSGALTRSANIVLTVTATPTPNFSLSGDLGERGAGRLGQQHGDDHQHERLQLGRDAQHLGAPVRRDGRLRAQPATPPANGTTNLDADLHARRHRGDRTTSVTVTGVSGALTRTTTVSLTVTGTGGRTWWRRSTRPVRLRPAAPPSAAPATRAPRSCSGAARSGPEPNQPNTIADSCADGTAGTFHSGRVERSHPRLHHGRQQLRAQARRSPSRRRSGPGRRRRQDTADFYFAANAGQPDLDAHRVGAADRGRARRRCR
jgi:hypothetical protein